MPELPDTVVLARSMEQAFRGKRIADVKINQPQCINLAPMEFSKQPPTERPTCPAERHADHCGPGQWLEK
jgi:formamidopyrimidine-DNA glycosylase